MSFFEILKVLFIGIIEGITEWLPISSTGHMIIAEQFIQLSSVSDDFIEMFNVVIQLGAIMAVVVLFWKKLWPFSSKEKYFIKKDKFTLWFKIVVACLPAAVIGIPLDSMIEAKFRNYVVVAIALIAYGIVFLFIEKRKPAQGSLIESSDQISYKTALLIGCFQVLSLIPGTSRSGTTIIGGMLCGTTRVAAAEFTFYLAIPVMFGASLIKLVKFGFDFTGTEIITLAVGMITAFVVSILSIKFLMNYIKKHDFKLFGWYRIVLGVIVLGYFIFS